MFPSRNFISIGVICRFIAIWLAILVSIPAMIIIGMITSSIIDMCTSPRYIPVNRRPNQQQNQRPRCGSLGKKRQVLIKVSNVRLNPEAPESGANQRSEIVTNTTPEGVPENETSSVN